MEKILIRTIIILVAFIVPWSINRRISEFHTNGVEQGHTTGHTRRVVMPVLTTTWPKPTLTAGQLTRHPCHASPRGSNECPHHRIDCWLVIYFSLRRISLRIGSDDVSLFVRWHISYRNFIFQTICELEIIYFEWKQG